MTKKLTLSINEEVINKAKAFSEKTGRSLSGIVQAYLENLTSENQESSPDPIDELFGSVNLPKDFNEKEMIRSILWEKEK
jgi:hypothetical protein